MRRLLPLLLLALVPLPAAGGTAASPEIRDPARDLLVDAPWADMTGVWFSTGGPSGRPAGLTVSIRTVEPLDSAPLAVAAVVSWTLGTEGPCWAQLRIIGGAGETLTGTIRHACDAGSLADFVAGGAQPAPVWLSAVTIRRDGDITHADIELSSLAGTPIASQYFTGQDLVEPSAKTRLEGVELSELDDAPNSCLQGGRLWVCTNAFPVGERPFPARSYRIGS